jgi:aspartyl-tRNA(Asn)/glutamyl-tRNA(Gln) amidotransferase subunit A
MPDAALEQLYASGLEAIRRELVGTDAPFRPPAPPSVLDGTMPGTSVAASAASVADDPLNAFITRRDEPAPPAHGPLAGVPFAVKDNIDVEGFPTTSGTRLGDEQGPAEHDAAVVADLREAGAHCVGKTNLGEIALEASTDNPHFGRTLNPRDPDRTPGGSSGGSGAAVATGQVTFGLGTDSGGSVRIPAAACGVVGFRPSAGAIPLDGLHGPAWSVDSIGVLAPRIAVAAAVLNAVRLRVRPPRQLGRARVAYLADASLGRCQQQVWDVYRESVERLRGDVDLVPVTLDGLALAPYVCAIVAYVEVAAQLGDAVRRVPNRFGAAVRPLLELGLALRAVDYIDAQRMRSRLVTRFEGAYRDFDALLTPTLPITAPRWGELPEIPGDDPKIALFALIRFTCLANLSGAPSVSLPAGVAADGLPVGVQLTGRPYDDIALLELAARVEARLVARRGAAA